jgi:hypothetical protein
MRFRALAFCLVFALPVTAGSAQDAKPPAAPQQAPDPANLVNGEVQSVNIHSSMITTNNNIDILMPNSEFANDRLTNWTLRESYRRVRIPVGGAYGTN